MSSAAKQPASPTPLQNTNSVLLDNLFVEIPGLWDIPVIIEIHIREYCKFIFKKKWVCEQKLCSDKIYLTFLCFSLGESCRALNRDRKPGCKLALTHNCSVFTRQAHIKMYLSRAIDGFEPSTDRAALSTDPIWC